MNRIKTILGILKVSFWNNISLIIVSILSVVAMIATILGVSLRDVTDWGWLKKMSTTTIFIILSIILFLIIVRILYVCAKKINEYNFAEKTTYTPVKLLKNIKDTLSFNNRLVLGEVDKPKVLAEICNNLRDIFDKITDSKSCVSIKVIEGVDDGNFEFSIEDITNYQVSNIARDNNHNSRDSQDYKAAQHFIRDNTAYSNIIGRINKKKTRKNYYINNNVSLENSYLTTSPYFDENQNPMEPPYKSELVFPILRVLETGKLFFVGFLCIDSDKKEAFKKDDVAIEIGAIFSDSLYWILSKY